MKKILVIMASVLATILCAASAYAYNVVDLPETMTLSDALEIYDVNDITSAEVANLNDNMHISLSRDEIKDFYYSASNITLYRRINPTPFRGTYVNFITKDGARSFNFTSGVQIGMYGPSNYVCYTMEDYDLSKFMYLYSRYEEATDKQYGADLYRNTDKDFLSLPEDLWAQSPVQEAASRSLVPYQLTKKYSSNISREEFCMLIGNFIAVVGNYASIDEYMAEKVPNYSRDNFVDCVGRDKSIDMLFALEVVNGKGGEYFDPDGSITREEAAKMLTSAANLFKYINTGYKLKYKDSSSISPWATFYVKWVTDQGIMNGIDSDNFAPRENYSVQQAIATVSRLYNVCIGD